MPATVRTQDDRNAPFPRAFARFNLKVANPVARLVAGWSPPLATSGTVAEQPGVTLATRVLAFAGPEGLVGARAVRHNSYAVNNLLVAGHAQVVPRLWQRGYATIVTFNRCPSQLS